MCRDVPDVIFFRRRLPSWSGTKSNLVGLKEATGNLAQASKTMALTDGKLDLYSGEDGLVVPLMSIGAVGVISVWSNVAPGKVHAM